MSNKPASPTDKSAAPRTSSRKSLETVKKCRAIVKGNNQKAHQAKAEGRPVAYCMVSCGFEPLLDVFDITPIWTENYAGLCAAKQRMDFIERAEADGYSSVICGYVRNGLGFDSLCKELGAIPEGSPDGGMARPDLLLGSSRNCDPRYKWYQAANRYLDIPIFSNDLVEMPIIGFKREMIPYYAQYYRSEYDRLVEFLEKFTGKKFDLDLFEEKFEIEQQVYQLWYEADMLRKAVPGPMPAQDAFSAFIPAFYAPTDPASIEFYKELKAEIQARVDAGIGVIENEKYRLLFAGGIPPWYAMWIFSIFEELGAVFVMDHAYRGTFPVEIPSAATHPLDKLAYRAVLRQTYKFEEAVASGSYSPDVEILKWYINDFKIDGMVMNSVKSCRAQTIGQLHRVNLIRQSVDLPFVQFQSDMVDMREYDEEHWKSGMETFIEALTNYKKV